MLQQIIITLLIVILVFLIRFIFSKTRSGVNRWFRPVALFLTAVMVQLIVISSGGFFSPFLILLYLFTLGTSFLLNVPASVSFLGFSLIILIAHVWLNQHLLALFKEDPFSVILYLISFIVIIPLAELLNRHYFIKDVLSKILSENLHLGQQREESILKGLNEIVLVTDKKLKILSVNQAAEEAINLSTSQIIDHSLLDIMPIKHKDGTKATIETLSIPQILEDKTARIIDDFYLSKSGVGFIPITIQVRPIVDLKGEVNQLVFVFKERQLSGIYSSMHGDLDLAHKKHQVIFEEFTKMLSQTRSGSLKFQAELLRKIEEDLLVAQEIEDHPIKESILFTDVAEACKEALEGKEELAKGTNVTLQFILSPQEIAETSLLDLKAQNIPERAVFGVSDFTVPIDQRWLQLILEKLLDMAIFLSSGQKEGKVEILVLREDTKGVNVQIITSHPVITNKLQTELLTLYFGQLRTIANLRLGSGLEGFIAYTIANQLKIPLSIGSGQYPPRLSFLLKLPKDRIQNASS